jgi:hypothetical protein
VDVFAWIVVGSLTGEELGEDPPHDNRGGLVDGQDVQPLAVGGFSGVGMRAGIGQLVPVRRTSAQEPVPLENRILCGELGLLGVRAARMYSLIRPFRTGFRRIR